MIACDLIVGAEATDANARSNGGNLEKREKEKAKTKAAGKGKKGKKGKEGKQTKGKGKAVGGPKPAIAKQGRKAKRRPPPK
eukprot:COSAG04_NODE_686_length_11156_cov_44.791806_8_plen_81_part_00